MGHSRRLWRVSGIRPDGRHVEWTYLTAHAGRAVVWFIQAFSPAYDTVRVALYRDQER